MGAGERRWASGQFASFLVLDRVAEEGEGCRNLGLGVVGFNDERSIRGSAAEDGEPSGISQERRDHAADSLDAAKDILGRGEGYDPQVAGLFGERNARRFTGRADAITRQ